MDRESPKEAMQYVIDHLDEFVIFLCKDALEFSEFLIQSGIIGSKKNREGSPKPKVYIFKLKECLVVAMEQTSFPKPYKICGAYDVWGDKRALLLVGSMNNIIKNPFMGTILDDCFKRGEVPKVVHL